MTDITTCRGQVDCHPESNQIGQILSNFIKGIFAKLKQSHIQRHQQRIDRDALQNLMALDETSLKDIGIKRDDIIWASKLAMHENASQELEKLRANNIATAHLQATRTVARRRR